MSRMRKAGRGWKAGSRLLLALLPALFAGACHDPMQDQGRLKPHEPASFFPDGSSARGLVAGTVPRGAEPVRGAAGERQPFAPVDRLPVPLTRELLLRGRERYDIFCALCHGYTGHGDGMIVLRGFTPPPSLHSPRVRETTLGHVVDVITNGWGAMYSYADRVDPPDRWAIAAYIRALQLSQRAEAAALPAEDRERLPPEG